MKYPYGFAQYPKGFIGCKVSPTKICMQFSLPTIKLRMLGQDRKQLPKNDKNQVSVSVTEDGHEFEIVATGCQMPEIEALQLELVRAYEAYLRDNKEIYKKTYNKDFKDFLLTLQEQINTLVSSGE